MLFILETVSAALFALQPSTDVHIVCSGCLTRGTLIAPGTVLTVAHGKPDHHKVMVVAHWFPVGFKEYRVKRVKVDPRYVMDDFEHDLAVLTLEKDTGRTVFPALHNGDLLPLRTPVVFGKNKVVLGSYPGNINLYAGFPHFATPGDSGVPVYSFKDPNKIVGVVAGYKHEGKSNVPLDAFAPVSKYNERWIKP